MSGALQSFNAGFVKPTSCIIFSCTFCLMFLIDAIKPKVEKKLCFVSFCFRFASGNKNIIQKKRVKHFRRREQKLYMIINVYSTKSQKGRDPNSMIKF